MKTISIVIGLMFVVFSPLAISENPYSPTETMAIKQECIELGRKYAQYVDSNQGSKVADLFDEHGTFVGSAGKYIGKQNIAIAFGRRPDNRRSHHVVTNEIAEVQSRNLVLVDSYYVYYRFEGDPKLEYAPASKPYSMGRYHDECVRTEEGSWLFQLRTLNRQWLQSEQ